MIDHICNKCGEPLDPANWWTVRIGDRFVSSTYKLCDGCAALADYTMRSMMGKGQVRKADANDTDAVSAEGSAGAVFVDGVQVFPPKALEHVKDSSEKLDADAASVPVSRFNETGDGDNGAACKANGGTCLTGQAVDKQADSTTQEVDSTTESLSDGTDSREKLLEDANAVAIDYWDRKRTWGEANDLKRDIIALLDRQASITEREILSHPDERDEQIAELQQQVDELSERKCPGYDQTRHYCKYHAQDFGLNDRTVSRLRRENSALARDLETARAVNEQQDLEYTENKKRIADLQQQADDLRGEWHRVCAERANLARDLGECMADRDRYRALCGQMLDAAHEIRRIADANMPEVAKEVLK